MNDMIVRRKRERGATLVLVTFVAAFLLIPIIGIAIDGAIVYWVKAKLSAAVDASALATARALSSGQTVAQQTANSNATCQAYFNANFPAGVMRTSVTGVPCAPADVEELVLHTRTVKVTAAVTIPLFFMRMLGFNTSTVSATGTATRRDANIMLVLDRSFSMNKNGSCQAVIASAQNFVNQFVEGRDQLGLVTFQTTAHVDFTPQLTFKSASPNLNAVLGTMICNGDTNSAHGLSMAYNQLKNTINQPGALNVILFFTDGSPNGVDAVYEVKSSADNRYDVSQAGNTLVPTPASNCQAPTVTGLLGDASTETALSNAALNATGRTGGIYSDAPEAIDAYSGNLASGAGCSFSANGPAYPRQDVKGIPIADVDGNSTVDGGYKPLDYFPAGYQYAGYIRPDMPRTTRWAGFNAADSAAMKVRQDTTYSPFIYSIGLSGNETMAMDQDFMERVANDPRASNYDPTRPQGQFVLATSSSGLSQAFQQISGQILRLSK